MNTGPCNTLDTFFFYVSRIYLCFESIIKNKSQRTLQTQRREREKSNAPWILSRVLGQSLVAQITCFILLYEAKKGTSTVQFRVSFPRSFLRLYSTMSRRRMARFISEDSGGLSFAHLRLTTNKIQWISLKTLLLWSVQLCLMYLWVITMSSVCTVDAASHTPIVAKIWQTTKPF